jgi:glycine/D-amino acid oxidase-like deaminating enzyme
VAAEPGRQVEAGQRCDQPDHRHGVGPSAGRLAADLITGRPTAIDPAPFRYERLFEGARLAPNQMV